MDHVGHVLNDYFNQRKHVPH